MDTLLQVLLALVIIVAARGGTDEQLVSRAWWLLRT
jgi:hypothetical protein